MIPSLLKWVGNKQKCAEFIVANMPRKFNNYYEPFLGSGAVMAELLNHDAKALFPKFEHAYCSDILPFLIDLFELSKTAPEKLSDYYRDYVMQYHAHPDETYNAIQMQFNVNPNPYDFLLLSRTCYSGIIRFRKSDGHMSTKRGLHNPISPNSFNERLYQWHKLIQKTTFTCENFTDAMQKPTDGDVVYCDPPYTHSQSILYGAQNFDINELWDSIQACKDRGVKVMLSINGTKNNKQTDISVTPPNGLFVRQLSVTCGTSMIDRLQNQGKEMRNKIVHDQLLLTW